MTATKFIVRFNEHVAAKQVTSMASGMAAYGNVLPGFFRARVCRRGVPRLESAGAKGKAFPMGGSRLLVLG
jgi:hypothetical protein